MSGPGAEGRPSEERLPAPGPRIYVASLSDYNAGVLHGAWLEADEGIEAMQAGVSEMLATSPTARRTGEPAEEWRIDDYDGWGPHMLLSEYEPLERVALLARGLAAHGEAFGAWASICAEFAPEDVGQFEEHYIGEYRTLEEFGDEHLSSTGFDPSELPGVPEFLRSYLGLDVAGYARDMEIGGDIATRQRTDGGVYVFWSP